MANSCLAFKGLATLISGKTDLIALWGDFRVLNLDTAPGGTNGVTPTKLALYGRSPTFEPAVQAAIALKRGALPGMAIVLTMKSNDEPRPAGAAAARRSRGQAQPFDQALA